MTKMATTQSASELKQQGALEAARDPNSPVTSEDAQKKIVEDSKNAGVVAFHFDPDASPEEKKAQIKSAVPPGFHSKRPKGVAVVTDIGGDSKPDYDLPSPSKARALAAKAADGKPVQDGSAHGENGFPMGPDTTGWAPRFGWPSEPVHAAESLLDHATWLEGNLPDKFYGDWYHNAAIIVFACLASWLLAVIGGGLISLMIIMAICSTYYRTSVRRVRRNFRDDISRELALKKLETDTESLEWMNSFMAKFWPIYQPVLVQTVVNSVDQVLSSATPAFLDSLKLKTFTLGSKPPRMEHVKTYPKAEDDLIIMDWKFSFNPNDTADMTSRQIKSKINPKVVLEIRVGKAMISKGLDVIVEDMAFSGIMRIKIKLQIPFPHVERVEMCFLEKPTIDYVCKPLGGETFGFDINFIPGLESFILEQIHGNLAPMMYAPNVFPIEVAKMLAGTPVDQAIGVVAITLHGAHGLKNTDKLSGSLDPYAVVSLNRRQPLAQTKTIRDTDSPRWNETHFVIVTSFKDSLDIEVIDYNEYRKDKSLGVASFLLENVEEITEYENERLEVLGDGKVRGVVSCDIRFFPVLEAKKEDDGTEVPAPESNTGILRFTVEQAKDLDGTKSLVGQLNPYANLLLNGKEVHATKKLKRTNNPIWDNGFKEILITDRKSAKLGVAIKDERELAGDQVIGTYQIKLDDMLSFMEKGQDWYNLAGAKTGRVKMQAQWKPVAISHIAGGTGGYITPVGVMRVHLQSAKDLRNFETFGKSDPYVRILLSGIEKARTVTFKNDLDPEWDEVLYVPVHSPRDRLHLEVMDAETMGRDRSLGSADLFVGDYITQDESGEYLVNDTKRLHQDGLRLHGQGMAKGVLNYTVAFYPTLNVADPEDEEEEAKSADQKKSLESSRPSDAEKPSKPENIGADGDQNPPATPLSPTTSATARKSRDEKGPPKVHLTPEELLKYESGLVVFRLLEAELPRSNTRVELFVDDMAYPSYASSTARNRSYKFDEIGDCFIRELDFSKLTLAIRAKNEESAEGAEEHTLARLSGNTLETLKQCLNNPTVLKMKDEEGRTSWVKVSLKYLPVKMQLDPSESINNMGSVRVDVLDAQDLPAADANGKSDPYVKFDLNEQEVFKTKVQKKTLSPAWNEFFEVAVHSRIAAKFKATVWDWDFADSPDLLGHTAVDLAQLEPFKAQEVRLPLDGKSGSLRLRLLFRPDYITRTGHGTSTFSGTFGAPGRMVTGVAGAPIKGGAAVAGVMGHGVGKGASFLKRGFSNVIGGGKDSNSVNASGNSSLVVPTITTNGPDSTPDMAMKRSAALGTDGNTTPPRGSTPTGPANGGLVNHSRTRSVGGSSIRSGIFPGASSGTASFTVVSATGFPPSSEVYVAISQVKDGKTKLVGKTKHHKAHSGTFKFDETFKVSCTPDSPFKIEVKENHKFSSDNDLGDQLYHVDDAGTGEEKEVKIGDGSVFIRSSFTPSENNTLSSESPKGGLRRSFLSKKDARAPSRETTPNP